MSIDSTVDLRSDTITQPTPAMREAIANAILGDDCIDKDPTVERLQELTAEILGKEAAIFMPSGSMTNQVAVRVHCQRGEEFLCEAGCHVFNYEQGAFAQLSGVVGRPIQGDGGIIQASQFEGMVRPDNEHFVRTRLVCLENTHNRGAGRIQPYEVVEEICSWAKSKGLARHLDGARLFNAVVASGRTAAEWASHFDTVSVCFSKGLGAPVGSALAGPRELIAEARRHRKVFGGGMRQAGIIAAGALHALEHHIERLADDHRNAQILADAVRQSSSLSLHCDPVETNIVIANVAQPESGRSIVNKLAEANILALPISPQQVRFVTHLDVDEAGCRQAADVVAAL